ncbi:MAG TPA: DUF922 domain-containing protein [Nitrospira sp.]
MSVEFVATEWDSYDVQAETLEEAAEAISDLEEAATAEWFPRYEYEADQFVTSAVVTVATKITMPRWVGVESAGAAERAEWERFCAALRSHEEGHVQLVTKVLADVDTHLIGESVDAARKVWDRTLEALAVASRAYDLQTDHGRKLGTVLDLSVSDPVR